MNRHQDSENALEDAVIALFESELSFEAIYAEHEILGDKGTLGRETLDEVVLVKWLRPALYSINPQLSSEAVESAVEELRRVRSAMDMAEANREIHVFLRDGIKVHLRHDDGSVDEERVRIIDWNTPSNNEFLLVQQFWVLSLNGLYKRRADLVVFINGLPLVFIELKASHRRVQNAFQGNLRDYRDTISHIFWYNAFIILSNGRHSQIGTVTAEWEQFGDWKKLDSEREEDSISLETMIRGTCEKSRLLDLIENFLLFKEAPSGLQKLLAKNHQYLGVNNAVDAVERLGDNRGKLGVFWHTQGSGKSLSMIFFAQKVLRRIPGNWTFLIVTDRLELDEQIYKNFADVGVVPRLKGRENDLQAQTGDDLKRMLRGDQRYIFTLIQKFHTRDGEWLYPVLSYRDDIIVITDEAHRSQYAQFAANMRRALPNAAFIGFTGTPLIAREQEKTREIFGDYVSVYNFRQSIQDGATVPLYYENRIPQLQLTNEALNEELDLLLDDMMLELEQEDKVEREFAREYHLITRDDRLETIAADIAAHYADRGFAGQDYRSKAMVVCIDKLTTVRLYNKVQKYWRQLTEQLEIELVTASDVERRTTLLKKLDFMRETDMAVVLSQAQNEIADFKSRGIDITPHRQRIVQDDLATDFKNPENPFRVVFVCAMWMTGFDAPSCSTIYLDKPMRNHTLMQTIARANRVFKEKQDGLIVDYIGVFRDLEKALAIYGSASGGGIEEGDVPVQSKEHRTGELQRAINIAVEFCTRLGIDLASIDAARGFEREKLKYQAVDAVLVNDETKLHFFDLTRELDRLYRSILPDSHAIEFASTVRLMNIVAKAIIAEIPDADISLVQDTVEQLLDRSITAERYIISTANQNQEQRVDLSQIDFDALQAKFEQGYKRTAAEKLRTAINGKLRRMIRQNRTRLDYQTTFQHLIDDYNSGAVNVDHYFDNLIIFADRLEKEAARGGQEHLDEEELALFDLLMRHNLALSQQEIEVVKQIAREILVTLKRDKLVLDWRRRQQTREAVRVSIKIALDQLPDKYDKSLYDEKCKDVYQHIYESYFGVGLSIYDIAA